MPGGDRGEDFPDFVLGGGHEVNKDLARGGTNFWSPGGGSPPPPHLLTYDCTTTVKTLEGIIIRNDNDKNYKNLLKARATTGKTNYKDN